MDRGTWQATIHRVTKSRALSEHRTRISGGDEVSRFPGTMPALWKLNWIRRDLNDKWSA